MQDVDDPHDDAFLDAPPDPEFENERCWEESGTMRRNQPAAFRAPAPANDPNAPIAEARFLIDWVDQHHTASYPADPGFPNGSAIDVALDATQACRVELSYPAQRCGVWVITCRACGYAIALSTTGRRDDPRSVRVPCRPH